MEKVFQLFNDVLSEQLIKIVISNAKKDAQYKKIEVKPFLKNDELLFQFARYTAQQVFHKNLIQSEAKEYINTLLEFYKQIDIQTNTENILVLISKKGKITVKRKQKMNQTWNRLLQII